MGLTCRGEGWGVGEAAKVREDEKEGGGEEEFGGVSTTWRGEGRSGKYFVRAAIRSRVFLIALLRADAVMT